MIIKILILVSGFFVAFSVQAFGQGNPEKVWWENRTVRALCAGPDKSLYLHLRGNRAFIKTNLNGKILKTWTVGPEPKGKGAISELLPTDTALLRDLKTMVADKAGNIYFLRKNNLAVYQLANGRISVFVTIPDSREKDSNLDVYPDLTIDASGNLYVMDGVPGTIWKISPDKKLSQVRRDPKVLVDSVQWAHTEKETYIAATPRGEFFLTEYSDSPDSWQQPDLWFLNKAGKVIKKANGGYKYPMYADGDLKRNCMLWPYNFRADGKDNLYFADHISWVEGKTFWHFSAIRRLSPDGLLQTVAGCNAAGRETNTVVAPDRSKKAITLNGRPIGEGNLKADDVKDFADYNPDFFRHSSYDKMDLEMELLGESKDGLFFRTGDDVFGPLFVVASTDELFVLPETAPLIRDRMEQKVRPTTANRIELTRIKVQNGVHCSPVTIELP